MACSHSSKSIVSVQQSEKVESAATQHEVVTQSVQTGPETVTTVVEEFALPPAKEDTPQNLAQAPSETTPNSEAQGTNKGGNGKIYKVVNHGPLLRRTTTVDQRGPTSTSTSLNAQASTETHAEAAVKAEGQTTNKSRPSAGCAFGLGVWGLASLAGMVLALLAYLKGLLPWKP